MIWYIQGDLLRSSGIQHGILIGLADTLFPDINECWWFMVIKHMRWDKFIK